MKGQSYVVITGARLGELARTSLKLIREHQQAELARNEQATIKHHRSTVGYHFERWIDRRMGWFTAPTDGEILKAARADSFSALSLYEASGTPGRDDAETCTRLARLADEAGPAGSVHLTADDAAALWGYAPPATGRAASPCGGAR